MNWNWKWYKEKCPHRFADTRHCSTCLQSAKDRFSVIMTAARSYSTLNYSALISRRWMQ